MSIEDTKEEAAEISKITKAFSEGVPVEGKYKSDLTFYGGSLCVTPCWDFNDIQYRIKPVPKMLYKIVYQYLGDVDAEVAYANHSNYCPPGAKILNVTKYQEVLEND